MQHSGGLATRMSRVGAWRWWQQHVAPSDLGPLATDASIDTDAGAARVANGKLGRRIGHYCSTGLRAFAL